MRILLVAAALAAGCSSNHTRRQVEQHAHGTADCPGVPGVIPDDGNDDREALQRAIDGLPSSGGVLCLPPGTYDFTRPPASAMRRSYASIDISNKTGVTLRGKPGTQLRMLGDGGHVMWVLLHIRGGSSNTTIQDLTLDGSARTNTVEQTHLLQLGESNHTTVENVTFNLPQLGDDHASGGDCVRLLGEDGAEVKDVTLRKLVGTACARSFVAIQRGVDGVALSQSTSVIVGGQSIDFEPTGKGVVRNFSIVDNVFARGPNGRGAYSVAIGGGRGIAQNVELARNKLPDGGLMLINVNGAKITDNEVTSNAMPNPVLLVIRDVANVEFARNTITKIAAAGKGPLAVFRQHHDLAPHDIKFVGGAMVQEAEGNILRLDSIKGFELNDVTLAYKGASTGQFFAIDANGITQAIDGLKVKGGTVRGQLRAVARFAQRQDIVNGTVEIDDVKADGPAEDATFERGNKPTNIKMRVMRGGN